MEKKEEKNYSLNNISENNFKSFLGILGIAYFEKLILFESFWEEAHFLDSIYLSFPKTHTYSIEIIKFFQRIKLIYCQKSPLQNIVEFLNKNEANTNFFKEFMKILIIENADDEENIKEEFVNLIDENV